jgi:hypothetical protein
MGGVPPEVSARRLEDRDEVGAARVGTISLPVPGGCEPPLPEGRAFQVHALTALKESELSSRLLVGLAGGEPLPEHLALRQGADPEDPELALPEVETRIVQAKKTGIIMKEEGEVSLRGSAGDLRLRLGLRTDSGLRSLLPKYTGSPLRY